jgi:hypothetical protein
MQNPTAREQFVYDYLLVVDNDQDGYREALEIAREAEGSVFRASDKYREQFEEAISQVVEREREEGNTLIAFLISQLLIGLGSAPFDDIAKHYIDTDLEQRVYDRLSSQLKTGN